MEVLRCMKLTTEWPLRALSEEGLAVLEETGEARSCFRIVVHLFLNSLVDPIDVRASKIGAQNPTSSEVCDVIHTMRRGCPYFLGNDTESRKQVSLIKYGTGTGNKPKEMVYPRISSSGDVSAISLHSPAIRGGKKYFTM